MPRALPLYDENTISITNLGPANRSQVEAYIKGYLEECNIKIPSTPQWRVNIVTNSYNENTGSAYIYFKDPRLYHIFLGNNPDGSRKTTRVINPYYGDITTRESTLQNIELSMLPYIEVPCNREIPLPTIQLEDYQLEDNNFNRFVRPDIGPCVMRQANKYSNVLICERAPTFMTETNFLDLFSFYIKDEEDKGRYPIINVIDKGRSTVVEVTFPPDKIDAIFAEIMVRKVKVLYRVDKLYVLSFKLKSL